MPTTAVTTIHASSQATDHTKPSFIAPAYAAMAPRWKLCREVMIGTEAVRDDDNLDTYFPRGPAESPDEQKARAMRAEFFPIFKETIKGLVGLVFRKDPKLGDDVPPSIVALAENIDGAGTHYAVFARRVFTDGMIKGHSAILVDVPKVSSTQPLTIQQERSLGLRPYWVHIKPEQILNWRTQTINGNVVLTMLVLAETVDVPMGDFGTTSTTRYRVFRRDTITGFITYEIWTQASHDKDPELDDHGTLKNTTVIPFVVFYAGERTAPLQSLPPLIDLAYTNVAHAQVLSDHRTSMHAAGNPILVIKGRSGFGGGSIDPNGPRPAVDNPDYYTTGPGAGAPEPIITGPNVGIEVDKDGDVHYAEHNGSALGASAAELKAIEDRAAAQGLSMLNRASRGVQTAEAEHLQRNEKDASLSSAARSMEDALEIACAFTAIFMGLTTGGSVEIDREFDTTVIDTPRIQALSAAVAAGQFTRETFWSLLQRGGALPPDFDPEEEARKLDEAGAITLPPAAGTAPTGGSGTTTGNADAGAHADAGGSTTNSDGAPRA